MVIDFRQWFPALAVVELALKNELFISKPLVPVIDPLKVLEDAAFTTIRQMELVGSLSLKEVAHTKLPKQKISRRRALRGSQGRVNRIP